MDILLVLQHTTEEKALDGSFLSASELALFKRTGNLAEALIEFAKTMSDRKQKIDQELDLQKLRIYTYEEQADDETVRVLLKMGKGAHPLASFLSAMIPQDALKECQATIASKKVPNYGLLSDKHHSNCYRIYHLGEIETYYRNH